MDAIFLGPEQRLKKLDEPHICFQQEDQRLHLEAQHEGLELQGLQSHEVLWSQERAVLQQEVRLFRRNTIIFYMKLRGILLRWRLGRRDDSGDETFPPEVRWIFASPLSLLERQNLWIKQFCG